jgi:lipid-A-disaccharide synthase
MLRDIEANRPLRLAIIAGEESGDLLGADLVAALRTMTTRPIELSGVGGQHLAEQGLVTLFDPDEIALMGFTAVIAKLPRLIRLIGKAADAVVAAEPDCLLIIDSPDFTHRVAKRVRAARPDLPIINYVCPSVWAWRPGRAKAMRAYVDHVLTLLPFEPDALKRLEGPPGSYVGHRLVTDANVIDARKRQEARQSGRPPHILLLPGSRRSEVAGLLGLQLDVARTIALRRPGTRFSVPAVPRLEATIRDTVAKSGLNVEIKVGADAKWQLFGEADAALAASGTVLLELALCKLPVVSIYRPDVLAHLLQHLIVTWSGALPNLIVDYPLVPEYYGTMLRASLIARQVERLATDSLQRGAQIEGFCSVIETMKTAKPSGEAAAGIVLDFAENGRRP